MIVTRVALLLSAFLFSSLSFAQSVPPASPGPVSYPVSTIRNVSTLGAYRVAPDNVARHAFSHAIGGLVQADAQTVIPMQGSARLPVTVSSQIPKSTAAAAIGRFAVKALPVLSVGAALYDLGQELGFGLDNSGGTLVVTRPEDRDPSMDDPWENRGTSSSAWTFSGRQACTDYLAASSIPAQYNIGAITFTAPGTCSAMIQQKSHPQNGFSPFGFTVAYRARVGDPPPPQNLPSSVQEFEDAIASGANYSPNSAYSRALRDAINSGEIVPVHPHDVTGPASTPGPVTTTTDSVNNTTTTSTTTNHHTYNGPNVTTTTTTTTVTVDNTTNNVISSTTTTTQPVLPDSSSEEEPDVSFSDTALPPIPKLYEPKYPEGLVGVWDAKKAELESTTLLNLVSELMPNVGSSGTCPSWVLSMNLAVWDFGSHDVSPPCWLWDFARAVIIACALLLARRLIFGG